ncbi:flagellar biosynthesis protein FlhA [Methylohalobius crimeensis]|uniref:flagellar biosynthesis protein FlhA n=1 Tax=Methylohalobius crimeensis TaxID=244365 RepID=UPI0003B3B4DE|nr:flagellar biosynthesis protein FlhA [Methylohalobius crimeensis]
MNPSAIMRRLKGIGGLGLGAPILVLLMLMLLVLPLPAFVLDLFFTFNIAFSLIILLVVIYTARPLDFAVFPTVLLVATLLRLGLNVASTRVVLLEGHTSPDAAGRVIEAFGAFVIGGNFAVGLVVFAILVIINFVVITKGAGRVSEVSARFTLDAMPGKQMAIDADLNAGLLSQDEARVRRAEVAQEADFYGAMDGASKFVRGDAVAGILILFINIIGGLVVGMAQHEMSITESLQRYVLLTIGDGLVAQIPSLLLSVASAILVTRVTNSDEDVGRQFSAQFLDHPKPLAISAGVIGSLGLIPGMPNLPFLILASILGGSAWYLTQRGRRQASEDLEAESSPPEPEVRDLSWEDVMPVDRVGLQVGYRLIPLVDKQQGGQLMSRIKGVRKKLSQELGFLIPSVHIRDNLDLAPNAYRLQVLGVTAGEAEIHPDREMAINPGQVFGSIQGVEGKDPAFGLDAVWIDSAQKDHAQALGYTVVDSETVVATHLSQVLQDHAHQLFGHEEGQQWLDNLAKVAPKLAELLVPQIIPLTVLVKVLQRLLKEKISIRDMITIAETLAEHGGISQDSDALTAAVRTALGRAIVQKINGLEYELPVITLDPELEQLLQKTLQNAGAEGAGIEPGLAQRMHQLLEQQAQSLEATGKPAVLLVSALLRAWFSRFVRHSIPGLHVLAYNEVPEDQQIKVVGVVGQQT